MLYLVYLIFILSVALAAGGVVISSRLRNKHPNDLFSTLLYFQVFIFTFGFYGIWGRVVIKAFLAQYISEVLLVRFTDILMLLGLPFLIFAWLMLIQFSNGITGRKNSNWLVLWFLLINFLVVIAVGYIIAKTSAIEPAILIKYYYLLMNFVYTILASFIMIFPPKGISIISKSDLKIIAASLFLIMFLQSMPLLFYKSELYIGIIFVFAFFAGNAFLPLYLNYGLTLPSFDNKPVSDLSFEEFCSRYEISPREKDIVGEICNGLSNQEISDKLFISLQTVKDHTHRIYIKTNVRSRVQLINLVQLLLRNQA